MDSINLYAKEASVMKNSPHFVIAKGLYSSYCSEEKIRSCLEDGFRIISRFNQGKIDEFWAIPSDNSRALAILSRIIRANVVGKDIGIRITEVDDETTAVLIWEVNSYDPQKSLTLSGKGEVIEKIKHFVVFVLPCLGINQSAFPPVRCDI